MRLGHGRLLGDPRDGAPVGRGNVVDPNMECGGLWPVEHRNELHGALVCITNRACSPNQGRPPRSQPCPEAPRSGNSPCSYVVSPEPALFQKISARDQKGRQLRVCIGRVSSARDCPFAGGINPYDERELGTGASLLNRSLSNKARAPSLRLFRPEILRDVQVKFKPEDF
jgi:hypothetical protein